MKLGINTVVAGMLAASLVVSYGVAGAQTAAPAKKHTPVRKAAVPKGPTVEEQLQQMRQEFQGKIDALQNSLNAKDDQLRQAQQAASDAQAAAAKAQAAADSQQQAVTQNASAVSSLQSTVDDMKGANASAVSSLSDDISGIKKSVASPDVIYYKGMTISPSGSFLAAETVWRQGATGGDINTPFTGVPLNHSEASQLSEFQGTGRQSRVALKAQGKLASMTMTGYYEADWLSAGATSNSNQSNSYTMRQRQLWAEAKTASGWTFNGGQGWSLATEQTQGLTRGTEILPATIDSQYVTGFVWGRQYSFRVIKDFSKKMSAGFAVEGAETLNPAGSALPANLLIGSGGTSGGLYNGAGNAAESGALANYSFNYTPDFVIKVALEPGWGHWEVFGVERNFRDRIYPTGGTPYNDQEIGAGIGGGFRVPMAAKRISVGAKGLWGQGVGRYGSSTIADVTIRPNGVLSPIHGFSALSTLELNPTPRFTAYFNYGVDYLDRNFVVNGSNANGPIYTGYGVGGPRVALNANVPNMSGCLTENASTAANPAAAPVTPSNCGGNNKDVQEFTAGYWYNIYNGPKGRLRQGIQYAWFRRDLWSGNGGTTNPGNGAYGTDNMVFTSFRYYIP